MARLNRSEVFDPNEVSVMHCEVAVRCNSSGVEPSVASRPTGCRTLPEQETHLESGC